MNFLNLKKPIIFFDLETTGLDHKTERIVQIGLIKIFPDGRVIEKNKIINPDKVIPEGAYRVHGIDNEVAEKHPKFKNFAKALYAMFKGCDIAGYNSNRFDIPFLTEEFRRNGIDFNIEESDCVDVFLIEKAITKRKYAGKLTEVYNKYTNSDFDGAHDAMADIRATIKVLEEQIRQHGLLNNVDDLIKFQHNDLKYLIHEDKKLVWNFGKHKGKDVNKTEVSYCDWFIKNHNSPLSVRNKIKEIING